MQAVAITDSEGKLTGKYTFQGSIANKALELIGKDIGMFKDAAPVQVHVNGIVADSESRAARFEAALDDEPEQVH